MEIIRHPACTHSLGAPADMQDGSCESLPVFQHDSGHGIFTYSFWRPSAGELEVLKAGGMLMLGVRTLREAHPVVSLSVTEDPV